MNALDLPLREQTAGIAAGELDPRELLDACLAVDATGDCHRHLAQALALELARQVVAQPLGIPTDLGPRDPLHRDAMLGGRGA